jgi:hypothetical protein
MSTIDNATSRPSVYMRSRPASPPILSTTTCESPRKKAQTHGEHTLLDSLCLIYESNLYDRMHNLEIAELDMRYGRIEADDGQLIPTQYTRPRAMSRETYKGTKPGFDIHNV